MNLVLYQSDIQPKDVAVNILGPTGRCISGAKHLYLQDHRRDVVVLDAVLALQDKGEWYRVWSGDLNITREFRVVAKLAYELRQDILVLDKSMITSSYIESYIVKFLYNYYPCKIELGKFLYEKVDENLQLKL